MRLEFRKGAYIDEKGNELTRSAETPVGNIVMMNITKTKACPPTRRVGFYTLNYETGIDYLRDLIDVAIKYSIIDKHGAWYSIIDPETGEVIEDKLQGAASVHDKLDADAELLEKVEELVNHAMSID
jgi:recombination protein RecA